MLSGRSSPTLSAHSKTPRTGSASSSHVGRPDPTGLSRGRSGSLGRRRVLRSPSPGLRARPFSKIGAPPDPARHPAGRARWCYVLKTHTISPVPGPTRPLPITEPRPLAAALKRLDERERRVLELRYGLRGERQHLLAEVGRVLGVSRERARQLETSALAKLGTQSGAPATRGQAVERPAFLESFVRPWTLLSLRSGPAHGYELKERLRARGLGEFDYRFLRRLEREGVVRSSWEKGTGVGPERRVYRLTSKGTRQLREDADAVGQVIDALTRFMGEYDELMAGHHSDRSRHPRGDAEGDGRPEERLVEYEGRRGSTGGVRRDRPYS